MNVSNIKQHHGHEVNEHAKKLKSHHAREDRGDHGRTHSPKAASDRLFLNNIKPDQAREFLHNRIGRSIDEHAPRSQASQAAFSRSFPTADATASHIIDNVAQAANTIPTDKNSTTEESGNSLAELITKIQDGFQQAREALDQLGALSSGFAPEFDEIEQKVNSFLQFLEDPENNPAPVSTIETTEIAASQESYQTSSQASIQIETRDGDIVTIDLSNSHNQQQSAASIQSDNQDGQFSGYVYEAYSETENSFSFTVSGDLDDDELNAISALVGDIGKTVGQFEKGNVNAALNIAKNIDTQSEELSGFSFNVQTSEQYRAIDLYQKTQVATTQETAPATSTDTPATPANENVDSIFSNNISNHIYAAESANILDAAATVNSIFEKFYQQLDALNEKLENLIDAGKEHEEASHS